MSLAEGVRQGETMARTFTRSDDLQGTEFVVADLRGARFVEADLSGVVMRGADIDAPWLFDGDSFLRVNGVDVIPFVEAELNRRFPGRADRRAEDPNGLRSAWAALERTWATTISRVPAPRTTAWTCRSSPRSRRRTPKCSRSGRAVSRWCATSSLQSRRTS